MGFFFFFPSLLSLLAFFSSLSLSLFPFNYSFCCPGWEQGCVPGTAAVQRNRVWGGVGGVPSVCPIPAMIWGTMGSPYPLPNMIPAANSEPSPPQPHPEVMLHALGSPMLREAGWGRVLLPWEQPFSHLHGDGDGFPGNLYPPPHPPTHTDTMP